MAMEVRRVIHDAHDQSILCVAFNTHRRELITGGQDGHIKMWEHDTGKCLRTLVDGHLGWVTGLAYASAQRLLLSVSIDAQLIVWDSRNKCEWFQKLKTGGQTHCVEWDNRRQLVYVGGESVIRMYVVIREHAEEPSRRKDRPILRALKEMRDGHSGIVRAIVSTETGKVFSAGHDASLCIHDVVDGASIRPTLVHANRRCHSGAVSAVAFDTDNNLMITGSFDRTAKVWSPEGKLLQTYENFVDTVTGVCYVPATKMIWVTANSVHPFLYDRTGTNVTAFKQPVSVRAAVRTALQGGAGTGGGAGGGGGSAGTAPAHGFGGFGDSGFCGGGADDADILESAGDGGKRPERLVRLFSIPATNEVVGVTSSRDLVIWRHNAHGAASVLQGHTDWVEVVAYTRKVEPEVTTEPLVVLFSAGADSVVRIWEPASRLNAFLYAPAGRFPGHEGAVLCGYFCEPLNAFITGSDDCTIRVWFQPTTAAALAAALEEHGRRGHRAQEADVAEVSGAPAAYTPGAAGEVGPPAADSALAEDAASAPAAATATAATVAAPAGVADTSAPTSCAGAPAAVATVAAAATAAVEPSEDAPQERSSTPAAFAAAMAALAEGADPAPAAASPASDDSAAAAAAAEYVEATCEVLEGHTDRVTGLVVLGPPALSGTLVSVSWDLSIRWWTLMPEEQQDHLLHVTENAHDDYINGIAYSPLTHEVATCSADQGVKIWDAERRTLSATLSGHKGDVTHVAWNSVLGVWMTGSDDQTLRAWSILGQQLRRIDTRDACAALSSDLNFGFALAAFNDTSYGLRVYDLGLSPNPNPMPTLPGAAPEESAASATAAASAATGVNSANAIEGAESAPASAPAAEGGGGAADHREPRLLHTHFGHKDSIRCIAHIPDKGQYVTAAWDHTLRTWHEAAGGRRRPRFDGSPPLSAVGTDRAAFLPALDRADSAGGTAAAAETVLAYADRHPLQKPRALQKDLTSLGISSGDKHGESRQAARRRGARRQADDLLSKSDGQSGAALKLHDLLADKEAQLRVQLPAADESHGAHVPGTAVRKGFKAEDQALVAVKTGHRRSSNVVSR